MHFSAKVDWRALINPPRLENILKRNNTAELFSKMRRNCVFHQLALLQNFFLFCFVLSLLTFFPFPLLTLACDTQHGVPEHCAKDIVAAGCSVRPSTSDCSRTIACKPQINAIEQKERDQQAVESVEEETGSCFEF